MGCDIPVAEFVALFRGDEFQQPILDALNIDARKKRYVREAQERQRAAAKQQRELQEQIMHKGQTKLLRGLTGKASGKGGALGGLLKLRRAESNLNSDTEADPGTGARSPSSSGRSKSGASHKASSRPRAGTQKAQAGGLGLGLAGLKTAARKEESDSASDASPSFRKTSSNSPSRVFGR